jgi:hypothetical protein
MGTGNGKKKLCGYPDISSRYPVPANMWIVDSYWTSNPVPIYGQNFKLDIRVSIEIKPVLNFNWLHR